MKKCNPKIILASISGFGQSGQYSQKPGYDVLAQAMGGLMSVTGEKNSTPVKAGYSMADLGTGMWAAFGILASLWDREKTKEGQWIDLALLDTIISWQTYLAGNYFATGKNPGPLGTEHPNIVPYQVFEASNGSFVVAIANDKLWSAFLEKINLDVLRDDKYTMNHDRVKYRDTLIPILEEIFKQRTREEWEEFFNDIKVPFGPVNNLSEILQDSHVFERGMIQEMKNNEETDFKSLSIPVHFSKSIETNNSFPPKLGENTEEVLEKLGFKSNEIESFLKEEIVKSEIHEKHKS